MRGIALIILILAAGMGTFLVVDSPFAQTSSNQVASTALGYARQQMTWMSGPSVVSTHVLLLSKIGPVLRANVPKKTAANVNVQDLMHRFGAQREVGLVVLRGVFNTLPPDEGVVVHADVVVLVDVKTNKAIYIND